MNLILLKEALNHMYKVDKSLREKEEAFGKAVYKVEEPLMEAMYKVSESLRKAIDKTEPVIHQEEELLKDDSYNAEFKSLESNQIADVFSYDPFDLNCDK